MSSAPIPSVDRSLPASRAVLARATPARRVTRWMTLLAVLPAPLWFTWALLRDPGPSWRAQYFSQPDFGGSVVTRGERRASVEWDSSHDYLGGDLVGTFASTRWETCLHLDRALSIPFQLVSEGGDARFLIDETEQLRSEAQRTRSSRGEISSLQAGNHLLTLELRAPGTGVLALNASFDGRAPRAVGEGALVPGIRLMPPAAAAPACR